MHSGLRYHVIDASSTEPLARPFICVLSLIRPLPALLVQSAALNRLLAHLLTRSLTHFGAHVKMVYVVELDATILAHFNPVYVERFFD